MLLREATAFDCNVSSTVAISIRFRGRLPEPSNESLNDVLPLKLWQCDVPDLRFKWYCAFPTVFRWGRCCRNYRHFILFHFKALSPFLSTSHTQQSRGCDWHLWHSCHPASALSAAELRLLLKMSAGWQLFSTPIPSRCQLGISYFIPNVFGILLIFSILTYV